MELDEFDELLELVLLELEEPLEVLEPDELPFSGSEPAPQPTNNCVTNMLVKKNVFSLMY